MKNLTDNYNREFRVVNKPVEKSRWNFCEDIGQLVGRNPIVISTMMKGLTVNDIKGFLDVAKTYTRPDIEFWNIWRIHKPKTINEQ